MFCYSQQANLISLHPILTATILSCRYYRILNARLQIQIDLLEINIHLKLHQTHGLLFKSLKTKKTIEAERSPNTHTCENRSAISQDVIIQWWSIQWDNVYWCTGSIRQSHVEEVNINLFSDAHPLSHIKPRTPADQQTLKLHDQRIRTDIVTHRPQAIPNHQSRSFATVPEPMGFYQICKIVSCACTGNAGNVFPATAGCRSRHASWHVRHARAVMYAGIAKWRFTLKSMAGTSNGSWCIGIKGEMSGTVCVTFTWDIYIYMSCL